MDSSTSSPPPRTIQIVARDPGFGRQLAPTLNELDATLVQAVDAYASDPAPALVVFDGADQASLRAITSPVIAVIPQPALAEMVEAMSASEQVAAVVVAASAERRLGSLASRILRDDVLGVDRPDGSEIHRETVKTHAEKQRCVARIAAFAAQRGVRHREAIEQCADELLMNALYDAPIGADGQHLFTGVAVRDRVTMRTKQTVEIAYACDQQRFTLAVRDAFGSLQRATVLRYLHKCLHDEQQLDRKAGGAGVGLYLVATAASTLQFRVIPGIATETVCEFELLVGGARPLDELTFLIQRDRRGQEPTGPARRITVRSPLRIAMMIAAVAVVALLGVLAIGWMRPKATAHLAIETTPPGAKIALDGRTIGTASASLVVDLEVGRTYVVAARLDGHEATRATVTASAGANPVQLVLPPLATLEVVSEPPGAIVHVDGKPLGTTPLALTELPPGASVAIDLVLPGYRRAVTRAVVPVRGQRNRHTHTLERSPDHVRVRFESDPPGARIVDAGQSTTNDRTYTPADVYVQAGVPQRFTLTMPGRAPLVIEPFTPRRDQNDLVKGGQLVPR